MNTSYMPDIILLILLFATCGLNYVFHSGKIDHIDFNADTRPTSKRSVFYPAQLIRQAGLPAFRNSLLYWSIKIVSLLLAICVLISISQINLTAGLVLSTLAFFLLDLWLLAKREARKQKIDHSVEYFISLLLVYLKSGNNLSHAFHQAAQYGLTKQNPLAQELMLVASELDAGRERQRAFTALAQRTGVKNLAKLANIIQVGMNMGTPLNNCLESQLCEIRLQQEERLTAEINRKSLETMLPMLLICFPVFLVLVFFPAAIQIMDVISLLAEML